MSKKSTKNTKKKNIKNNVSEKDNSINMKGVFGGIRQTLVPNNVYVKNTALALVFFVLFLFFILSSLRLGGALGRVTYKGFSTLLGYGYYVLPMLFLMQAYFYSIHKESSSFAKTKIIFSLLLLLSILGILELSIKDAGGILGGLIAIPILNLFDNILSYIFLIAVAGISLIILFEYSFGNSADESTEEDTEAEDIEDTKPLKIRGAKTNEEDEKIDIKDNKKDISAVKDSGKSLKNKDEKEMSDISENLISTPKMTLLGKSYTPPPLSLLER